ncbi:MAG: ABC transporter ATP-binding protein [Myxococcales bacterium]|nr:ABC transporter ATP-binding protein [Myxococcales bacterium]
MQEVIAVEKLARRFGPITALDDVSFTLAGPQVIGILGPNGAGKTTLLEILQGLQEATRGTVRLFGAPLDPRRYPRRRIGVVMQREFVFDRITAFEYADLFAAIHRVPRGREAILLAAGLEARADLPVQRLSGGESQRLFIAAASVHAPDLLFLDEPTTHLDPESKRAIGLRLRELAARCTVVLTTHDLREADAVCDHAVFLVDGRVKAEGSRAALCDAVPEGRRTGRGLEDAFFHFCAARLAEGGGLA